MTTETLASPSTPDAERRAISCRPGETFQTERAWAVSIHATVAADGDSAGASAYVQLLPAGRFSGRDGRGPYDAGDRAALERIAAATLQRAGAAELVIDYDHQSVFAAVPGVGGRAPAAGWIKALEVRDDGLWGLVEWTETAAQAIKGGEYRYLSPVFAHDKAGRVLRLHSAGLTNSPNLDLAAVAASQSHASGEPMKRVAKALGLADDADEDGVLAAVNSLIADRGRLAAAAGLKPDASAQEIAQAVQAAVAQGAAPDPSKFVPIEQVTAMQADLAALRADIGKGKAEAAVDAAIESGRLAPSLRDWGLSLHAADPAKFEAFIEKAPVLTAPQRGETRRADPAAALDDTDQAVMAQMGLTSEAMLETRKKEAR